MLNCRVEWLTRVSFRRWACSAVPWPPGSSDLSWVSLVCRQTPWMPPTKEVRETHTKNYSPVTIFHFFDVLSSMRMWVCYLMQSCLLPPPVVLLSLLIHVFFLYILNIFVFLSCQMWRRLPEPCRGPKETPKRRKRTMRTWVWIRAHTTN